MEAFFLCVRFFLRSGFGGGGGGGGGYFYDIPAANSLIFSGRLVNTSL